MRVRLSILKEYLSCLMLEGRIDDAKEKFPDMEEEDFDYIVANQPGGSNNKYLMWSLKQAEALLENDPDRTALRIVTQTVRLFDANKQRVKQKDINQYADVGEVEAAIEELDKNKTKSQEKKQAKSDTDTIYEDDRFVVVRPHTTEASCKYGTGTRWCIAATKSKNYYSDYSSRDIKFYFVIDKKAPPSEATFGGGGTDPNPTSKFAIAIYASSDRNASNGTEVYNAQDHQVGLSAVAKHVGEKWPEMWEKISGHLQKFNTTREVEDARKETDQHIKALLSGEKVSEQGILKIARDGKLTGQIVKAIISYFETYKNENAKINTYQALANRSRQMPHDAAIEVIKWIVSMKPADTGKYWPGGYYLDQMLQGASLAPEDFNTLADTNNEQVLANLMSNPSAPEEIRNKIGAQVEKFKDEVALRKVAMEMIKSGHITAEQLKIVLEKQPELISTILWNPDEINLSSDLIKLLPIKDTAALKQAMKLPNVPQDFVGDVIDNMWKTFKKYDLYEILKTANISVEKIEQLWNNKDQHVRTALLQNPSIGGRNLAKFAGSKNSAYRFAVAHNTATPSEALSALADDESVSTRGAVGANPNTPTETLKKLASDEAISVRASVASNGNVPRETLELMKRDSDEFVRKAVRKTLKAITTTESVIRMMTSMSYLLKEEMEDDDAQDIMTPSWREMPTNQVEKREFVAVFLLQNNGSATREEIAEAFQLWNPQRDTSRRVGGGYRRGYHRQGRYVTDRAKDIWKLLRDEEKYGSDPSRSVTSGGKGWFWSPQGINKGALFRLTPSGAAAAMEVLARLNTPGNMRDRVWSTGTAPPVKKSPPAMPRAERTAQTGPKTTYKIYGKFKGHPAATRLKGQAYVAPADTQFRGGEQAVISPEDGKLKVKKTDSDHTQTWEPTDG